MLSYYNLQVSEYRFLISNKICNTNNKYPINPFLLNIIYVNKKFENKIKYYPTKISTYWHMGNNKINTLITK